MGLNTFTFNGVDGTTLASGDAATIGASAITTSGGTVTLNAADAVNGSTGLRIAGNSGGAARAAFPFDAPATSGCITVDVRTPPTAPGGTVALFEARTGAAPAGNAFAFRVSMGNTGNIVVFGSDNVGIGTATILAGASFNTKYRISVVVTNISTTLGAITVKVYASGGTTPLGTLTSSTANLGANPMTFTQLGATSWGATTNLGYDNLRHDNTSTTEIPAYVPVNNPPTVTVTGPQNKATGETATITVSASDSDGTIATRSTAFDFPTSGAPSISGSGGTSPSFAVGSTEGALYLLTTTVTDDGGATASASTEVRVPITNNADATPVPMDATKTGSWSRVGGSSTDGAALNDASDSTYLESGSVSAVEQKVNTRLRPRTSLGSGAQIGVRLRSDTGTTTWQIRLFEGATLRQSWTQASVGTTWTEYLFTISDATLAAITDWGNLRVEAGVTT